MPVTRRKPAYDDRADRVREAGSVYTASGSGYAGGGAFADAGPAIILSGLSVQKLLEADSSTLTADSDRLRALLGDLIRRRSAGRDLHIELRRTEPAVFPDLHDPVTGRLDARRIADLYGVPLKFVADAAGMNLSTVQKTPNSRALQPILQRFSRIASCLQSLVGTVTGLRIWLNKPNAQLGNAVPLDLIAGGQSEAVLLLLDGMMLGQPD